MPTFRYNFRVPLDWFSASFVHESLKRTNDIFSPFCSLEKWWWHTFKPFFFRLTNKHFPQCKRSEMKPGNSRMRWLHAHFIRRLSVTRNEKTQQLNKLNLRCKWADEKSEYLVLHFLVFKVTFLSLSCYRIWHGPSDACLQFVSIRYCDWPNFA